MTRPIFELEVLPGYDSSPDNLGYSWTPIEMTKRALKLKLDFKDPSYISMEKDPEVLQIRINGGNIFFSVKAMQLELPEIHQINFRRSLAEQRENRYTLLEKKLPKQLPEGFVQEVAG